MLTRVLQIMEKIMDNAVEVFNFVTTPISIMGYQIDLFDVFTVAGLTLFLNVIIVRFFTE